MPEMKKSVQLIFKAAPGEYRVFQLQNWRVKTDYTVKEDLDKLACTCARFRFETNCPHCEAIAKPVRHITRGLGESKVTDVEVAWRVTPPKSAAIVVDEGKVAVVDPEVGDINLFNLLWRLTETGRTEKTTMATGLLNPNRIFVECNESVSKGVSVEDKAVIKAGEAAKPVEAAKPDAGFDETLTSEPEDVLGTPPKSVLDRVETERSDALSSIAIWKKTKRPDPSVFAVERDVWEQMIYNMSEGKNILLIGPTGSGKTELAYLVAKALKIDIEPFNMGAMSEPRTSLIGNTHFNRERGTWFDESRFVRAVRKEAGAVLLDEITRAVRDAFNILLPLLDRQGYLALDESEGSPVIKKGPKVCFVSTANVGMEYTGTDALDIALKNRFGAVVDVFFPPSDTEIKVLLGRCAGLSFAHATKLVNIATRQRELSRNEGEFVEMVSTRMLLNTGMQIAAGLDFKTACKFCIINHFSADGGDASDRTKICQVVQKVGEA